MRIDRQTRINILSELGDRLRKMDSDYRQARQEAFDENPWFIPENIDQAVHAICDRFLNRKELESWLKTYPEPLDQKIIGLVMAGNIPLVGFHDFLCVFGSGHKAQVKLSSKDSKMFQYLFGLLKDIDSRASGYFRETDRLQDFDAVIATGSNNTSRYFEYYFAKYPHVIRKNRNGTAILTGDETEQDLMKLSSDVFDYFGLGCRNVTKLYVPSDYDFTELLKVLDKEGPVSTHHKYRNNYDYNYALFLLNREEFMAGKHILLKEDKSYISRISCLHFERYNDNGELVNHLMLDEDFIQCICTRDGKLTRLPGEVVFGDSQKPTLSDYADGVDIMDFLSHLV